MTDAAIEQLQRAAFEASQQYRINRMSLDSRMAYAEGVRTMAALITACANAAEQLRDELPSGSTQRIVIGGYADGLRHIAEAADDLIPAGYEP